MAKDNDEQIVSTGNIQLNPTSRRSTALTHGESSYLANRPNQSIIFQKSQIWSRAIGWSIMGLIVAVLAWASFANIDEAIPADGKLEPLDDAKKIQAPMGGVVKETYVKNGDIVQAGALLLKLESTVPESQLSSLASTKASLEAENSFYRAQMNPNVIPALGFTKIDIKPEILALTKSRNSLVSENQMYRAEISGKNIASLDPDRQKRLESNIAELNTRLDAGKSEIGQVKEQIAQNEVRRQGLINQLVGIKSNIASINSEIANGKDGLATNLTQIERQLSQNRSKIKASRQTLSINQKMLAQLRPAGVAGAIAATQIQRQEQEVVNRASELEQQIQEESRLQLEKNRLISANKADIQRQQQRIQEQQQLLKQHQSEISQQERERDRLKYSATQSVAKLDNNKAVNQKDLYARLGENDKRIAEIDSQLNKSIVENEKKITEITNQIAQAKQSLKYQEIRSPVAGEIFEMKAYKEGVVNSGSPEALVQIIPSKDVIAKVFITNKDIGFVKKGQLVDVRIDTFNFSEFGDVKGTIEWIGSDALPPDQIYPFARFPARIKLAQQTLVVKGKASKLKAGMSVKANIKLRDRTVISLFTEMFSKQSDGVKNLR
jgi:hemolysin D